MPIDSAPPPVASIVITWPAPASEIASPDFAEVSVSGVRLFVYQAPVRAEILPTGGLASHKPDYAAERAAFVIFDMSAPVTVRVVPGRPFKTATLRPERAGIATRVDGDAVEFTLDRPQKMTLLLDNDTGWNMLGFDGARHVRVEGITLRNAANWNFTIGKSEDIEVRDVRIIRGRINSDGINSVNSSRVRIHNVLVDGVTLYGKGIPDPWRPTGKNYGLPSRRPRCVRSAVR